jgi:hypothetical protein
MDRNAARHRRGLDGPQRRRDQDCGGTPFDLHALGLPPLSLFGLGPAASVRGVWRSKILAFWWYFVWPCVAPCGPCWACWYLSW